MSQLPQRLAKTFSGLWHERPDICAGILPAADFKHSGGIRKGSMM